MADNTALLAHLRFNGDLKDEVGNEWVAVGSDYSFSVDKPGFWGESCLHIKPKTRIECVSPKFTFGVDDFTIEFRVWRTANFPISSSTRAYDGISLGANEALICTNNNWRYIADTYCVKYVPAQQWSHVAYVRAGDNGYYFVDGELKVTDTGLDTYNLTSQTFAINTKYAGMDSISQDFYLDELRVYRGAKWTDTFIPPEEPDEENFYTIQEKYQDEEGTELKVSTSQKIEKGEDYLQVAVSIKDYDYLGYKLDEAELKKGSFIAINEVEQDHTVVFIYKKKDETGSSNNGDNSGNGEGNDEDTASYQNDSALSALGGCRPVNIFNFYQSCPNHHNCCRIKKSCKSNCGAEKDN